MLTAKPCRKPSRHWGCSRLAMVTWVARVGLNLIAAAARNASPLFWACFLFAAVKIGTGLSVLNLLIHN